MYIELLILYLHMDLKLFGGAYAQNLKYMFIIAHFYCLLLLDITFIDF